MCETQVGVTAGPPWQAQCEALYRAHAARLVRLGRLLLRDPQEAQEVAQEVFVRMVQAYQMPDRPRDWGHWLTRVTVNLCHDRRRAGWWSWWRRRSDAVHALEVPDADTTPDLAAIGQESRRQIWQAFRGLPARQRQVFALRYLEGWSTRAVADALQLSEGSVKRHLFRAVQRMRAALGGTR